MNILITGGCKNGKSFFAQELIYKAAEGGLKYYIATMEPVDAEDEERVLRHQLERVGYGYETIELPTKIEKAVDLCHPEGSVLLDSSTALLSNEMFSGGEIYWNVADGITEGILELSHHVKNLAVVSDWIYSDANEFDEITEHYRKALAGIDRELARHFDIVCEVSYGHVILHKGERNQWF